MCKNPSESCQSLCIAERSSVTRAAEKSVAHVVFPLKTGKFESSTG